MGDGNFVRGTTPPLVIKLKKTDLLVSEINELELTITQPNKERCKSVKMIKHLEDCTIDVEENTLTYFFTEDDTLAFSSDEGIALQCRFKVGDRIVATGEKRIKAERLLSNQKFDGTST